MNNILQFEMYSFVISSLETFRIVTLRTFFHFFLYEAILSSSSKLRKKKLLTKYATTSTLR